MTDSANPFAAPAEAVDQEVHGSGTGGVFERDRYLLKQKMIAISEKYYVYGDEDEILLFVQRPARVFRNLLAAGAAVLVAIAGIAGGVALLSMELGAIGIASIILGFIGATIVGTSLAPLRHMSFRAGGPQGELLLEVSQDNRWVLPHAWFTLRDAQGTVIARFQKNVIWNMLRRRWYIHNPEGELQTLVKEDSLVKSILRRTMPDFIAMFMRTNFVFMHTDHETVIGNFNRKLAIRDFYALDMSKDQDDQVDRRIAVAMAVLLDTGERR